MQKKWFYLILVSLLVIGSVYLAYRAGFVRGQEVSLNNPTQRGKIVRSGLLDLVNPILECDIVGPTVEINEFQPIKDAVDKVVNQSNGAGKADVVSVYMRALNTGRTIGINEDEKYSPASMLKVVTMMAVLRIAETNPAIMKHAIVFDQTSFDSGMQLIKPSVTLAPHQSYTVEDLLKRMITYSENDSLRLLDEYIAEKYPTAIPDVYTELHVPEPSAASSTEDFMSTKDYSALFRVLYNASFLNTQTSEFGLQLLSNVEFTDGIVAGVPTGIVVAHKFGEHGLVAAGNNVIKQELHDCGIVYYPQHPYFICIMTKGKNIADLQSVIATISHTVYTGIDQFFTHTKGP